MGIWIRSQDGNILTLCTDINIQTQNNRVGVFNNNQLLGEYDSMDEAWVIIDCVQKQIEKGKQVFGMPQAGVVDIEEEDDL